MFFTVLRCPEAGWSPSQKKGSTIQDWGEKKCLYPEGGEWLEFTAEVGSGGSVTESIHDSDW